MKKKIISLVLVCCMLCMSFMLTSCESTSELVENAIEKTSKLDSYAAVMKMDIEISADGSSLTVPMTIDMKVQNATSDKPLISAGYEMSMFGQKVAMDMYSDGEWIYVDLGDLGGKGKANMKDAMDEYAYNEDVNDMIKALPEEVLEEIEPVENEDGTKTVKVQVPAETFKTVYSDLIDSMSKEYLESGMENINIGAANVEITIAKSGYIVQYDIEFTMSMTVEGTTTKMTLDASIEFTNPGEAVEVTPMKDCESFPEIELP